MTKRNFFAILATLLFFSLCHPFWLDYKLVVKIYANKSADKQISVEYKTPSLNKSEKVSLLNGIYKIKINDYKLNELRLRNKNINKVIVSGITKKEFSEITDVMKFNMFALPHIKHFYNFVYMGGGYALFVSVYLIILLKKIKVR